MTKYVDKSALVAEIERRRRDWRYSSSIDAKFKREECDDILSFLDTLETKEVDLEKEIQQHINDCLDIKFPTTDIKMIAKDVEYTARKFFELGLKAKDVIEIIKTAEDHAYFAGSENTREKLIDKACKWLKENKDHPFIGCEDCCLSGFLTDEFIEEFRKAMEE